MRHKTTLDEWCAAKEAADKFGAKVVAPLVKIVRKIEIPAYGKGFLISIGSVLNQRIWIEKKKELLKEIEGIVKALSLDYLAYHKNKYSFEEYLKTIESVSPSGETHKSKTKRALEKSISL